MGDALIFLLAPSVLCLLLAGIHCYLGLHVLARGVIFVDLSLAQVAALGATVALLFGISHDGWANYFISLSATFLAAILFALARREERRFSQEAIIGITYAFSSAAVVLIVDRLAHGAEHIKELLIGRLLWVTWGEVLKTAIIYLLVALIHYIFRKKFLAATFEKGQRNLYPSQFGFQAGAPDETLRRADEHAASGEVPRDEPENQNPMGILWDFLFYALFGVVITSSVSLAGVLQVFAYLIVPAILSSLVAKTIRGRLLIGWAIGAILSIIGMGVSYKLDLPAGAFLVTLFTAIPIVILLLYNMRSFFNRSREGK